MNPQLIKAKVASAKATFDFMAQLVRDEREALYEAEAHVTHVTEAQAVIQVVAQAVQEKAHDRIAGIVTHCLQSVFGLGAYKFQLIFEKKRGRTECRPVFIRDGNEVSPLAGGGGGAADVAAFALRLVCLMLSRPEVRKLLILDEPWKHLSTEYRSAMCDLVEDLSTKMGVQFLIVTHSEEFNIGTTVRLTPSP